MEKSSICVTCKCDFRYHAGPQGPQRKYCSEQCQPKHALPSVDLVCLQCEQHFAYKPRRGQRPKFCSHTCYRAAYEQGGVFGYAPHSKVSFPVCDECGRVYCRHSGARAVNICPDTECQRRAHNRRMRKCLATRRARKAGAFVEYVDHWRVFERDGYRCHLCGRKTLRGKRVPHLRAPTVDHVIPLSRGGRHEYLNCRTACFSCNARKNAFGGGEQLLLIS